MRVGQRAAGPAGRQPGRPFDRPGVPPRGRPPGARTKPGPPGRVRLSPARHLPDLDAGYLNTPAGGGSSSAVHLDRSASCGWRRTGHPADGQPPGRSGSAGLTERLDRRRRSELEEAAHRLGEPGHARAGDHADPLRADRRRQPAHPVDHDHAGDRVLLGEGDRVRRELGGAALADDRRAERATRWCVRCSCPRRARGPGSAGRCGCRWSRSRRASSQHGPARHAREAYRRADLRPAPGAATRHPRPAAQRGRRSGRRCLARVHRLVGAADQLVGAEVAAGDGRRRRWRRSCRLAGQQERLRAEPCSMCPVRRRSAASCASSSQSTRNSSPP